MILVRNVKAGKGGESSFSLLLRAGPLAFSMYSFQLLSTSSLKQRCQESPFFSTDSQDSPACSYVLRARGHGVESGELRIAARRAEALRILILRRDQNHPGLRGHGCSEIAFVNSKHPANSPAGMASDQVDPYPFR